MFENTNANFSIPNMGMGVNNNYPSWGYRNSQVPNQMQGMTQNGIPNTLQNVQLNGIFLKAMPVTSFKEAEAAMVTDGNMYVFVNVSQGEIYTKQFNLMTGASEFLTYKLYKPTENAQMNFVTYDDLKKYDDTLKQVTEEIEKLKGGIANAKSNATSTSNANGYASKKQQ